MNRAKPNMGTVIRATYGATQSPDFYCFLWRGTLSTTMKTAPSPCGCHFEAASSNGKMWPRTSPQSLISSVLQAPAALGSGSNTFLETIDAESKDIHLLVRQSGSVAACTKSFACLRSCRVLFTATGGGNEPIGEARNEVTIWHQIVTQRRISGGKPKRSEC
jgi:hypothetical protein